MPKLTPKRFRKAEKMARYYYAYFNFMNHRPTYKAIAIYFGRSETWAGHYLNLARDIGLIRKEWTIKTERQNVPNTNQTR